jgi:hypothetical protein
VLPPLSGWKPRVEKHGTDIGRGPVGIGALSEPVRAKRKVNKILALEKAGFSDTSIYFIRLHGVTYQKTVFFIRQEDNQCLKCQ